MTHYQDQLFDASHTQEEAQPEGAPGSAGELPTPVKDLNPAANLKAQQCQTEDLAAQAEKTATLERELLEAREETAIQQSKFELEVRHALHWRRKYDNASVEIEKLKSDLAAARTSI